TNANTGPPIASNHPWGPSRPGPGVVVLYQAARETAINPSGMKLTMPAMTRRLRAVGRRPRSTAGPGDWGWVLIEVHPGRTAVRRGRNRRASITARARPSPLGPVVDSRARGLAVDWRCCRRPAV